jgi:DHA1 family multidrug resistance protein-like MFS transporter
MHNATNWEFMQASSDHALIVLRRCLFIVSMPMFYISFALPVQSRALGASALEIGGLFSLFTFSILLMRPVIGFGIDYLGRRLFFLLALLLYIGAYTGYTVAGSIEMMYVARFFQGIGAALLLITVDTMTTDLAPTNARGESMGRNMEFQTRASAVGATIGFSLVGIVPLLAWRLSFGLFAVLAVVAFIYALLKLPESRPDNNQAHTQHMPLSADLIRLFALLVLLGTAGALILPIYLIYLQDSFTEDPRMLSWAFLPAAFVFMFLPSKLGALADRLNPRVMMAVGMLTAGCLYFAMPLASNFWILVLVYSLSVIGWSLIEPTRRLITASLAPTTSLARTFGLAEMAYGLGATAGPLIGGYLYDHVSHTSPFMFNGGLMLVAAVASIWLLRNTASKATP